MAQLAELENALINADMAGDKEAASILANEIIQLRLSAPKQEQSLPKQLLESAKQAGSGILEGAVGVVNLPMEATRAAGEVFGVNRKFLPLSTAEINQRNIESGITADEPETLGGKAVRFTGNVLGGAATFPSPKPLPAKPLSKTQQTLVEAQKEGFVVPPSEVKPSTANLVLESVSGKAATRQAASIKNQEIINKLVAKDFGLPEGQNVTASVLKTLRDDAGKVYEQAKSLGVFTVDKTFRQQLGGISGKTSALRKEVPELINKDIQPLIRRLATSKTLSAESVIESLKVIRSMADDAYAAGNKTHGKALRSIADSIEGLAERNIDPKTMGDFLGKFRNARQLIAKTYTAEKALNTATDNVSGQVLARELSKGKPLTGGMKKAAEFAQAFPRAAQKPEQIGSPSVSKLQAVLSAMLGTAGGMSTGGPGAVAAVLPFTAPSAARSVMFSKPVQASLVKAKTPISPATMRAGAGFLTSNPLFNLNQDY